VVVAGTVPIDPEKFRAFELAGWEQAAGPYADHWTTLTRQTIDRLLTTVRSPAGTKLLDVATGPGWVAAAAAQRGVQAIGIDFSPAMVGLARRAHPDSRFLVGDAEALPVRSESCDAVVMNFGLLHLGQPERAVAEARRALRQGGRFAFTVWAPPDEAVAFDITLRAIRDHGDPNIPLPAGPPFFRYSDPEACCAVLRQTGFVDPVVETLPLLWRLPHPAAAFEAMHRGTARTGGLLRRQAPQALAAIRAAVLEDLAAYARDSALAVPMPAVLASATAG
jgi:SAM-dependent methyltransferase